MRGEERLIMRFSAGLEKSQGLKPVCFKLWLALAALGVVWGTTWVASDSLAEQVPPLLGAAARCLLAALLWIPVILLKRLKLPRGRSLGIVLVLSASMIVLPLLLLLWARAHVQSATVTVIFAAMPLLVILLTPGLEGKSVPRGAMQAAIVGLGAISLAVGASFSVFQAGGAVVVLLAVASTGASSLVARRQLKSLSPVVVTALLLAAAALLLFLASMVLERGEPVQWNGSASGLVALLALASAAAYATYFWLLQQLEAYQVATVQWVQPLVGMAEAAAFPHLPWSFSMIAGSLVTFVCLGVVMLARLEDDNTVSLLGN
jgi:drug/metabolite transporter (DMT)-like permease